MREEETCMHDALKKIVESYVTNETMAYVYIRVDADTWRQLQALVDDQ